MSTVFPKRTDVSVLHALHGKNVLLHAVIWKNVEKLRKCNAYEKNVGLRRLNYLQNHGLVFSVSRKWLWPLTTSYSWIPVVFLFWIDFLLTLWFICDFLSLVDCWIPYNDCPIFVIVYWVTYRLDERRINQISLSLSSVFSDSLG